MTPEKITIQFMGELPPGTIRYRVHVYLGEDALRNPVGFTSEARFNAAEIVKLAIRVAPLNSDEGIGAETEIRDNEGRTLVVFVPRSGGLVPMLTKLGQTDAMLVAAIREATAAGLPRIEAKS